MSHHKNADYEIVRKSLLHHDTKESTQSQTTQIVVNLISDDNMHSMILKSTLSSLKQQAVVNSLSNKQILTLYSCFDDHDNNFLKRIKVKKFADYYDKFLCEHSE